MAKPIKSKATAVPPNIFGHSPGTFAGDLTAQGKVAWYALVVMLFLVPIAMSNLSAFGIQVPLSSDQFDIIKVTILQIGSVIALVAWTADIMLHGGKVRHTPILWLVLALLVWVSVATFTSIHIPTAFFGKYKRFEGLWSYLIYGALFFLTLQYVTNSTRIKAVAQAMCASSALVAFYGLLQAFGIDPFKWGVLSFEANRSFSTYGNPDLLAGFLAFGLFVSLGLALAEKVPWRGAVYWVVVLLNAAVIVTAFSRSIWVGSVVGIVFMVLFAFRQRVRLDVEDYVFGGGAALAAVGFAVASLGSKDVVMNFGTRVASIFKFGEGSAVTRFQIWQAAIDSIKARPIFGYGPDTFRLVFRRFQPVEYAQAAGYRSIADNVHNYPLQLASGIGIVGALMFYGVIAWSAVVSFARCWRRDDNPDKMVLVGLWCACAAYMVHLFFGLSLPGTTFLLWVSMAVLVAPTVKTVEVKRVSWAPAATSILCILAAGVIFYSSSIFAADRDFLFAEGAKDQQNMELWNIYSEKAVKANPFREMALLNRAQYLTTIAKAAVDQKSPQAATAVAEAEANILAMIDYVPWEYDNYALLVWFYDDVAAKVDPSSIQKAIAVGEEQLALMPNGLALRYVYAQALAYSGDLDGAMKQLQIIIAQDSNHADAVSSLAMMQKQKATNSK